MNVIPDFENIAMVEGARFIDRFGETRTVNVHQVGELAFPSGRVMVSDAFVAEFETDPALERTVPMGPHPVYISEASDEESSVIVTAWVRFRDAEIRSWTPAFYEGYEPDDTYVPGFGVDSGTACIADQGSAGSVNNEAAAERAIAALYADDATVSGALIHPDCENFFLCQSGIGDGFYTSYWGLDADGEPVVLMVDFDGLMVPVLDTKIVTTPLPRGGVVARFERSSVTVRTKWLPFFGPRKLVAYGGFVRVRARLPDGPRRLTPESGGLSLTYTLDVPDGTELEISATHGYQPATPL